MIADADAPIADIFRLIALEIARLIGGMIADVGIRRRDSQRKLSNRLRAYRELCRTLTENESLRRNEVLDLDGPQFQFVFSAMVQLIRSALIASGIEDCLAQNVLFQFADLVKENDETMRRELKQIVKSC